MNKKLSRPSWAACMLGAALTVQAPLLRAEMVDTEEMSAQQQVQADRDKVKAFLERANVVEKMKAMGVDSLVAKDRVDALSQEEVHALAERIDSMPAGALFGVTDIILILLVLILLAIVL